MKKIYKTKIRNQKGQISLVLIFLFFLIGGVYLFQSKSLSPSTNVSVSHSLSCVQDPPDATKTVAYNSNTYNLIRDKTPIPDGEIGVHLQEVSGIQVNGQLKEGYIVKEKDGSSPRRPNSEIYDEGSFDLLFVDLTSDNVSDNIPGYKYFQIYLKAGKDIPKFIKDFCNNSLTQPIASKLIMPDANGNTIPPLSFNIGVSSSWSLTNPCPVPTGQTCHNPPSSNADYYLYSYEGRGSESFKISTSSIFPKKELTFNGRNYEAYFVDWSTIQYIALVDKDPNSLDHNIAYKYVQSSYMSPFLTPIPTDSRDTTNTLQIKPLSFLTIPPWGWWSPECKPAIYLYPEKETKVKVTIKPKGFLTYTDPVYPKSGWDVIAKPNGEIISSNKSYPYLYYESKIEDSAINKPQRGYISTYSELPDLYDSVLPKLGLNQKETKDFKDYWEKYLPFSPYYFVGIMEDKDIDSIEPLTIDPKPNTIIRVRIYFEALSDIKEALDKESQIKEPEIITKLSRSGFAVVEWGGLVKVDKDHPFTCSQ